METEDGILSACTIDGDGSDKPLSGAAVAKAIKAKSLAWVHLEAEHPKAREWLEREISYLDHIIIDALLADETRPRILEFDKGVMMILRGVNLNENAEPEDMVSIRLWVDENRIISVRRRRLKAVVDIRELLAAGRGPKNAGDFIATLTGRLFERMEPVFTELDEETDEIEEHVMENPDASERRANQRYSSPGDYFSPLYRPAEGCHRTFTHLGHGLAGTNP